jgi:hypothetical protein
MSIRTRTIGFLKARMAFETEVFLDKFRSELRNHSSLILLSNLHEADSGF